MSSGPLLVLAAGGTGGHMFPAQALAEEMLGRGWRVKLTTDPRGARYVGGFPEAVQIDILNSSTFARGGLVAKLTTPFKIASGTLSATFKMRRDRPSAVVGFGGYPSIPALAAATVMRLPRMIHEQNGVLGRVNQLFAKRVDRIACGTWPTEMSDDLPAEHVGNPVRSAIAHRAGAGYIVPGDYPMLILVMGGSQGARILSDVVPEAIANLPEDIKAHLRVAHQARDEDNARVTQAYSNAGISAEVKPFFSNVPDLMSEAQLVITRSGASTIADLSVIGRPSILVPLAAAIRDEQTANARGLVEAGAAILMPESQFTPDTLSDQIVTVLENPEAANKMAQAALTCGLPQAAHTLADMVVTLSTQKSPS